MLEALGALASRHAAPLPMGDEPTDGRPTPLADSDPGFADVDGAGWRSGPALADLDDRERRLIEPAVRARPVAVARSRAGWACRRCTCRGCCAGR